MEEVTLQWLLPKSAVPDPVWAGSEITKTVFPCRLMIFTLTAELFAFPASHFLTLHCPHAPYLILFHNLYEESFWYTIQCTDDCDRKGSHHIQIFSSVVQLQDSSSFLFLNCIPYDCLSRNSTESNHPVYLLHIKFCSNSVLQSLFSRFWA